MNAHEELHDRRKRNMALGLITALVLGPVAMGIVVAVAVVLISLRPGEAPVAALDLMAPGAAASFDAQAGQLITFRADVDLDPRLGDSKSSRRQASSNLHASKIRVTVVDRGGGESSQECPLSGSGGMLSTGTRLYFSNIGLGCSFAVSQAGLHRVRATPQWQSLAPRSAALSVVVSGGKN